MGFCVPGSERSGYRCGTSFGSSVRPSEIGGLVLGACIISLVKKEFRPRGGSAPVTRFTLGAFVMIGFSDENSSDVHSAQSASGD